MGFNPVKVMAQCVGRPRPKLPHPTTPRAMMPMSFARLFSLTMLLVAACVAAPAIGAAAPAAIDIAAVPPRQPAPNDASAYRRFVLPNGMKVLLLSDPKLNVASASVAVGWAA